MKTLVLLGAHPEAIHAIRMAQSLGYRVIAVDANPNAPGLTIASRGIHIPLDRFKPELIARRVAAEVVTGVFCHAAELGHIAAEIAQRLGLPGLDPLVAHRCTDKVQRLVALEASGVPCPRFAVVGVGDRWMLNDEPFAGNVVIKPIAGAGARGVSIYRGGRASGDPAFTLEAALRAASAEAPGPVILEKYIHGPQISTETVIYGGRMYHTGFADRNYDEPLRFAPHIIEDGHTVPSSLPAEMVAKVLAVVEQAIRALGIDWGVAKCDVVIDQNRPGPGIPKIIEVACRTSGGRFADGTVPLATGVNILKPLIQMAMGDEPDLAELEPKFYRASAQRFFWPPPGLVVSIEGLDEARGLPGVEEIYLPLNPSEIVFPVTSHRQRVGYVLASGATRAEAVAVAELARSLVRIEVEPVQGPVAA